jgi:putative ABC transport system substrate-binding protein
MKRRAFLPLIGGAAALWLHPAIAQQPKLQTIGILVVQSPGSEQLLPQLGQELRQLGYIEGETIRFLFRSDQGKVSRLPEFAAELVWLKADIIVTWFTPAALAAKQATHDIPIVMALAGNPVETGLVESIARPGGNVTGISGVTAELAGKSVQLIQEALPAVRRVAALANALDPFSKPFLEEVQLGGKATGIAVEPVMVHGADELEAAFAIVEKERPDALIVQPSLGLGRPVEMALKYRVPAVSAFREFAEAGGLMSYSAVEADVYRGAARFVAKILKGASPAELPVEQPTKFELVIN